MRTTIRTRKEANEVCLKLWDKIEKKCGVAVKEYEIPLLKVQFLLEMGYVRLHSACPMCQYVLLRRNMPCPSCLLSDCYFNGYREYMTGKQIKAFNKFLKKTLGD